MWSAREVALGEEGFGLPLLPCCLHNRLERMVYRLIGWKCGTHLGRKKGEICSLSISFQVFSTNTALQFRQIVSGAQVISVRVFIIPFHKTSVPLVLLVENAFRPTKVKYGTRISGR